MIRVVSWNVAHRDAPWETLLEMDADVALLQEASRPSVKLPSRVEIDPSPWHMASPGHTPWKAAVVKLSDRVQVDWIEGESIPEGEWDGFGVSRPGTLAAATVTPPDGPPFVVASMYGFWENMHRSTGSSWKCADGSAHRLISDLSRLIGRATDHRIVAAGDLNVLYGYGENGSAYWAARYATVFDRMKSLGLRFVGPQHPHGRQADPWPGELPKDSRNVPTFHHSRGNPETATRQLDFVFASESLAESVQVRALNEPEQWGPSDHCRIEITIS